MQSTLYKPPVVRTIAAAMDASSLEALPRLADACIDAGVQSLTVCTLPADLRLAGPAEASAMLDGLGAALEELDGASVCLIGRGYYLPERITNIASRHGSTSPIRVQVAVDYACRASFLSPNLEHGPAGVLLLPAGCEPGNLLRWHYARAAFRYVDWQRTDAAALRRLIDSCTEPPLFRASTPPAQSRRTWNRPANL